MMDIKIGSNIILLNKNNEIEYEMACFDILEINKKNMYYFQSVDKNGKMEEIEISENILNLLDWQESLIPSFFRFDKISDILENYHNISQLDLKGFSGHYDNKLNTIDSISLYLSNNDLYIEIICFGRLYSYENELFSYTKENSHYFATRKENIPFIYIKESSHISDLHLDEKNKIFFIPSSNCDTYKMNDISCWSGEEYWKKLVIMLRKYQYEIPGIMDPNLTLEGYGVEFEPNIQSSSNDDYENMFLIFDHNNTKLLDIFDNGILIDTNSYEKVNIFTFIKNIKDNS